MTKQQSIHYGDIPQDQSTSQSTRAERILKNLGVIQVCNYAASALYAFAMLFMKFGNDPMYYFINIALIALGALVGWCIHWLIESLKYLVEQQGAG